jgi:hypothetical protein
MTEATIQQLNNSTMVMKTLLTIIMLCGVCYGYAQNTPPYAVNTKTWTFGAQTWSNDIMMPTDSPKGYTSGFTWAYVKANLSKMCPSPWRAPTLRDFKNLAATVRAEILVRHEWYGFIAADGNILAFGSGWWTTTDDPSSYGLDIYVALAPTVSGYATKGARPVSDNQWHWLPISKDGTDRYNVRCVKK